MANTSNFRQAIRESKNQAIIGPNVIANALPFVGMGVLSNYPSIFMPTFWVATIASLVLFFISMNVAEKGKNNVALPLLATYSLLVGYTLTGLIFVALRTPNVGIAGIGFAALGCGVTFIVGRQIGSNLSEKDGLALAKTVQMGIIALLVVLVAQLLFSLFGIFTPTFLEVAISGIGVVLFVGAAVVDFFILPRTYRDDQYLPAALSMYLTYINLFVFILRLLIAINSRD